jgi:hypothetical protein
MRLPARCNRPCRRAAEQRDKPAPPHGFPIHGEDYTLAHRCKESRLVVHSKIDRECLSWVICRHSASLTGCPLYRHVRFGPKAEVAAQAGNVRLPRKRTSPLPGPRSANGPEAEMMSELSKRDPLKLLASAEIGMAL